MSKFSKLPAEYLIPRDALPTQIGKPIHLSWAGRGCQWILDRIEGETLHLITPKTKQRRTAKANEAQFCGHEFAKYKEKAS